MTIEALNIGFARADKYLFRNLNFSVRSGELLRIEGQNGAGKTTLLKILAGLIYPDKGRIHWEQSAIGSSDYKSQVAFLGHRDGINLNLTVAENIQLQVNLAKATQVVQASKMLDCLALAGKEDVPCYKLSQGQRRKVALCALLLKNKKVWLLDEPFTSLDKPSIEAFTQQMQAHLAAKGMIILASHHAIASHQVVNL